MYSVNGWGNWPRANVVTLVFIETKLRAKNVFSHFKRILKDWSKKPNENMWQYPEKPTIFTYLALDWECLLTPDLKALFFGTGLGERGLTALRGLWNLGSQLQGDWKAAHGRKTWSLITEPPRNSLKPNFKSITKIWANPSKDHC